MALAIDAVPLARALIPRLQRYLDQYTGRFQIHRVCAHATVIHDSSAFRRLLVARESLAKQEALDWQADQGDDLDEAEVFHHLQNQAATSPLLLKTFSQTERTRSTTVLVASALSPSFSAATQGRPASSFHRHSLRCSFLKRNLVLSHAFAYSSAIPKVFPNAGEHYAWVYFPEPDLKIVWENDTGYKPFVVWNLQLDVVDLFTRITTYNPGKRRRTALNQFLSLDVDSTPGNGHLPERKRFKGVRCRHDRRTWVAEMKPYKGKSKVQFGEFKSQTQAARAVDAAFHHYGKPHLLNFPDSSPQILSARPGIVAGIDEEEKLRSVKEQAKWLASIASTSTLPSMTNPRPSVPSNESLQWSRVCSAVPSEFRSFSEITSSFSSGGADDADDGISQRQHPVPMFPCSPCSTSAQSSLQITDGWDAPEFSSGIFKNFVNPCSQSCMEFLVLSPPAPMLDQMVTSTLSCSQGNIAGHLWEPQSFGCE